VRTASASCSYYNKQRGIDPAGLARHVRHLGWQTHALTVPQAALEEKCTSCSPLRASCATPYNSGTSNAFGDDHLRLNYAKEAEVAKQLHQVLAGKSPKFG
jgi:hypothetical protein